MPLGGGRGIVGDSFSGSPVTTVYPFYPFSTETFALYPSAEMMQLSGRARQLENGSLNARKAKGLH